MKINIHIYLFLFCFPAISAAQKRVNIVAGLVKEFKTNKPVGGASVKNQRTGESTASNEHGHFYFKAIKESDSLSISAIGYEEKKVTYRDLQLQAKVITLLPRALQLAELTIIPGIINQTQHISKLDIGVRQVNNSQEVLRIVPGLFIGQHAGGGKAEQIFLRGFDVDHGTDLAISVDGLPVNMVSHAHGQGYADLHFLIPELIEKVSFKKGTYDAEKGNFNTAGYVAFKTKERLAGNSIRLEGGQFNTFRNVTLLNLLDKDDKSWYLAGEYMYSKGFFVEPQGFRRLNLFTKFKSNINERNELTLSASTFKSRWNASGQIPGRAVKNGYISYFGSIDPTEQGITGRTNFNAALVTTFSPASNLKNQLFYTHYELDLYSNFTFFLHDRVNGDQIRQKETRKILGYNGSYHNIQYLGTSKLSSEAGIQVRLDATRDTELSHTKDRAILLQPIQLGSMTELNAAAYLNETIHWNRFFSSNAGLRFDYFKFRYLNNLNSTRTNLQDGAAIVSPKININYHPNIKTELYFSAGKGFHSNDTRVVLEDRAKKALPSAYSTDLGINLKPVKNLFINAALWKLKLEQELVYVGDEGVVEPAGRTVRTGADLSIRYQFVEKIFFDTDFSYAHARLRDEKKGSDYIPLSPRFTASGGITFKNDDGFNGSLRFRYMGDRPANETNSVKAEGYFVSDASFGYAHRKFDFNVAVQNIFNVRWKETQFETESQLFNELTPVSEIHFTPGTPFFLKAGLTYFF